MDGFPRYNQIQIKPEDQHNTTFICPWDTFAYRKMPFGLKNTRATFQRAITFAFHDLKRIIEIYLENLVAHFRLRVDDTYHLRFFFKICHRYQIRLNPQKCIFCMKVAQLLGFIVSKYGIRVDPLKVEEILQLSLPCNILHLQCLQDMEKFLQRFVVNFTNLTKGFMRMLKKDIP